QRLSYPAIWFPKDAAFLHWASLSLPLPPNQNEFGGWRNQPVVPRTLHGSPSTQSPSSARMSPLHLETNVRNLAPNHSSLSTTAGSSKSESYRSPHSGESL